VELEHKIENISCFLWATMHLIITSVELFPVALAAGKTLEATDTGRVGLRITQQSDFVSRMLTLVRVMVNMLRGLELLVVWECCFMLYY
jgi:hypothetical protein